MPPPIEKPNDKHSPNVNYHPPYLEGNYSEGNGSQFTIDITLRAQPEEPHYYAFHTPKSGNALPFSPRIGNSNFSHHRCPCSASDSIHGRPEGSDAYIYPAMAKIVPGKPNEAKADWQCKHCKAVYDFHLKYPKGFSLVKGDYTTPGDGDGDGGGKRVEPMLETEEIARCKRTNTL